MNLCFALLDHAIIAGRADAPILDDPPSTHAALLEEVAAVGGVLRAIGVLPGDEVGVSLDDQRCAVVAALAALRLNAIPRYAASARVGFEDRQGQAHLVWAGPDGQTELDWPAVLKAGRTDPAPAPVERFGEAPPALPELPLSASGLLEFLTVAG